MLGPGTLFPGVIEDGGVQRHLAQLCTYKSDSEWRSMGHTMGTPPTGYSNPNGFQ